MDHYQLRRTIDIYVRPLNEDLGKIANAIDGLIAQTQVPAGRSSLRLVAPLVVLAVFLSPRLRFAALAMAPLAPLPALAAAILAIAGAPFAVSCRAYA